MLTQLLEPQYRLVCRCCGGCIGLYAGAVRRTRQHYDDYKYVGRRIVKYQEPETGVWWQVTDQNNRKGNYLESSASSLFVYFLCKAVNKGYIPVEYKAAAERGFNGLIKQFIKEEPDGSYTITNCCAVAGLGGKGNRMEVLLIT